MEASRSQSARGVYWDDTNNLAVATDGGGANKLIGKSRRCCC